ncbi:MAG: ABC transporter ATP-binding protein [Bacillota bacterium]|jgi:energy-coupling factor transporter ATPase
MGTIISLQDVSFNYEKTKRKVLKGINIDINEGEFVVITGPTGAGKTTLCETLNGVIPNFIKGDLTGTITVDGLNASKTPVYQMASRIGMVFQDPDTQLFGMTVEEDLAFGPANLGLSFEEVMQRVERSYNDLKIGDLKDRKPFELSGGQKQSVSIGGVYAMLPKIIVFDEPTSMLDPIGKERVFSIVKDINKQYGITIVLVEHEMNEIVKHADKVIVMNKGEVRLQGSVEEVFSQVETLKELGLEIPQSIELSTKLKENHYIDKVLLTPAQVIAACNGFKPKVQAPAATPAVPPTAGAGNGRGLVHDPIIEVENLRHSYLGDHDDLKGINLSINKGEFVAIIGQNGAGKTTLARHIIGLLKPNEGAIKVNGKPIAGRSVAELSREVGYVFQNPDEQIFTDSVEDELRFGPRNLEKRPEYIDSIVDEVLDDIGLSKYRQVWPKYLSKGERQRLAMGSIITMEPDVIIVDEPTTGQDWRETLWIMDLLRKLNQKGKTIIIITHNMEIVTRYCNRVLVMSQGEVILDGTPKEIFTRRDKLQEAYLRPTDITYIAQNIAYMPDDIISVDEFYQVFREMME